MSQSSHYIVTEMGRFECEVCRKNYTRAFDLRRHQMQKHHEQFKEDKDESESESELENQEDDQASEVSESRDDASDVDDDDDGGSEAGSEPDDSDITGPPDRDIFGAITEDTQLWHDFRRQVWSENKKTYK